MTDQRDPEDWIGVIIAITVAIALLMWLAAMFAKELMGR